MAIIIVICAFLICILIGSLFIMGVWNWLISYLAWSMFSYAIPNINLWQAVCIYFLFVIICNMFKPNNYNNN